MDTKERKTPPSGALFSPPDPKLAPGTAASGKKRLRRRDINFKGASRIFCNDFPSINFALQLMQRDLGPGFGLAP
ncbi:MAG TPA: hypothetical protein VKR55_30080 [Bradyrhizobium sp.]|jgi:hypothetical protein|uniref:hypothetical protein n=1 Tax=Bradyrhizobium sp. TaxID=376 RepID=UPI002C62A4ED|nr:hypothetical protein [Bradyrhizobium sp.]HLZ06387.1 hypothetical protein [Bradyrhizobium sp.]